METGDNKIMISAFVGCVDDNLSRVPIRGNGKTMSVTYAGYKDYIAGDYYTGRTILSNYQINFLTYDDISRKWYNDLKLKEREALKNRIKIISVKEMVEFILNSNKNDYPNGFSVLIDEIQTMLNSLATPAKVIKFFDKMQSQTRKRKANLYYATQRFHNLHKRCRIQTDNVYICEKIHQIPLINNGEYEVCYSEECLKPHFILMTNYYNSNIQKLIRCEKVGHLYDTDEIINETFDLD